MQTRILLLFLLLGLITACSEGLPTIKENDLKQDLDSILNSKYTSSDQIKNSLKNILNKTESDSLKNFLLLELSYFYSKTDDSVHFQYWNSQSRNLSVRLSDSLGLAQTYWDSAHFYYNQNQPDEAFILYSKAYDLYEQLSEPVMAGQVMLNIAICQKDIRDYTGSEISSVRAIELLRNSRRNKTLYNAHNNLGIIYSERKEKKKSLEHFDLALAYLQEIRELKNPESPIYNNIGVLLRRNEEYKEALKFFSKALSANNLVDRNPQFYAMALDNVAYTKLLLKDTTGILSAFNRALNIRDSIGHADGIVINKIHLSEYYAYNKDTVRAIEFAREANALAHSTSNNRDILASLKLLSDYDPKNSQEYLSGYIKLSDSLQEEDRLIRNKFTKIRFDTEQYIAENEELYGQRNVLIGLSMGIALLGLSGFVIKNQRTKNRELALKQEQQEANEKIFRLLLDQQNMKEEGRQKERKRLSEELHDGALSKLFGLRLSLTSLNDQTDMASIQQRENYLDNLKELEKEIRQLSHDLNSPIFTSGTGYLSILEEVLLQAEEKFLAYELEVDESINWDKIPGNVKLHLLRILQEAVKNIKNHSRANHVIVAFSYEEKSLVFTIQDNGKGFEPAKNNEGIGLKNMESRTRAMQGRFKIETNINKGTKILIQVPL